MIKSILITGCNRGLGLGLVKHLVSTPSRPVKLIATCRNLEKAKELCEIAAKHKNVYVLLLDVTNFDYYEYFKKQVEEILEEDGLNVLFNNAGVAPKSTKLHVVKVEQLTNTYITNTVAPIMLTKTLLPLLKIASEQNKDKPVGSKRAAILNMSSILGSISENNSEGLYPYKCSKAALNMATKTIANELYKNNIIVTSIHPGWVKTAMGGCNAPVNVETSVNGIVKIIYNLNIEHNGGFYQFDGRPLQW